MRFKESLSQTHAPSCIIALNKEEPPDSMIDRSLASSVGLKQWASSTLNSSRDEVPVSLKSCSSTRLVALTPLVLKNT